MARPTLLTPENHAAAMAVLENGATWQTVAEVCAVSRDTPRSWFSRGEADTKAGIDSVYAKFFVDASKARGRGKARLLNDLRAAAAGVTKRRVETVEHGDGTSTVTYTDIEHGKPDAKAALAVLRYQERGYSDAQRVELTGANGGPVEANVNILAALRAMTREDRDELEAALKGSVESE